MKKLTTRQLALDAVFCAMCAVLGALSLDFVNVKVTFESVPVLIGALMFGPVDGMAIGGIGTFIYQMLRYGFSVTTPLWILPYILCGALAGWYAGKQRFELTQRQYIGIILACELLITALNTFTVYADSRIYGYYFPGIVTGALALRLVICVVRAAAFAILLPPLIRVLRQTVRGSGK